MKVPSGARLHGASVVHDGAGSLMAMAPHLRDVLVSDCSFVVTQPEASVLSLTSDAVGVRFERCYFQLNHPRSRVFDSAGFEHHRVQFHDCQMVMPRPQANSVPAISHTTVVSMTDVEHTRWTVNGSDSSGGAPVFLMRNETFAMASGFRMIGCQFEQCASGVAHIEGIQSMIVESCGHYDVTGALSAPLFRVHAGGPSATHPLTREIHFRDCAFTGDSEEFPSVLASRAGDTCPWPSVLWTGGRAGHLNLGMLGVRVGGWVAADHSPRTPKGFWW